MNFPTIVDVEIGLIFIFFILSLLASEIQEMIATFLQWRAKHLKKTIEDLLAGGSEGLRVQDPYNPKQINPEVKYVLDLVAKLYNHPLINTLNQESRGLRTIAQKVRKSSRIKNINSSKNTPIFGNILEKKRSAASYIPAETFATTLLKTLAFPIVAQRLELWKLKDFKEDILDQIQAFISNSEQSLVDHQNSTLLFAKLKNKLGEIINDFEEGETDLRKSVDYIGYEIDSFVIHSRNLLKESNLSYEVEKLRQSIFGVESNNDFNFIKERLIENMIPKLTTIVRIYDEIKNPEHKDKNLPEFTEIKKDIITKLEDINEESHNIVLPQFVPNSVIDSLCILAKRAQMKARSKEKQMLQFQEEIETWYDRTMDRTMGVYKRNTKGMLLIIGFILSVTANVDTLNIVNRLSGNTVLHNIISQEVPEINKDCSSDSDKLICVADKARDVLQDTSIPLGWTESNLKQQLGWTNSNSSQQPNKWLLAKPEIKLQRVLQMLLGWCLSTVAISMGAPFWFDLLGKIVNVRNTGKKPETDTSDRPATK